MPTSNGSGIEAMVAKLLVPVAAASGAIVFVGFFFRDFVGEAVTGQGWVAISLLFFGSGLGYLAVLPYRADEGDEPSTGYHLRVRRTSLTTTLREFASNQDPVTMGVPVSVFAAFFLVQTAFPTGTSAAVSAVSGTVLRV